MDLCLAAMPDFQPELTRPQFRWTIQLASGKLFIVLRLPSTYRLSSMRWTIQYEQVKQFFVLRLPFAHRLGSVRWHSFALHQPDKFLSIMYTAPTGTTFSWLR